MNQNEWEARLRAANPRNDEIVPMSPESSLRILAVALRANRRRRSRFAAFWLTTPFRVAVGSAATFALAYCLMPYINVSEMPVAERTVAPTLAVAAATVSPVAKNKGTDAAARVPKAANSSPKPASAPVLPSMLPKPVAPQVMLARSRNLPPPAPLSVPERGEFRGGVATLAGGSSAPGLPPLRYGEGGGGGEVPGEGTDEGNMFVSVSGDSVLLPESDDEDDLTVTVRRDVPDTVSGSAEAAALHVIPVPSATPDPADAIAVPVWTHVRVETGAEPVLTVTALN